MELTTARQSLLHKVPRLRYLLIRRLGLGFLGALWCLGFTGFVRAQSTEFYGNFDWEQRNAGSLPTFYTAYSLGGGLHTAGWWLGGKSIQNRTFATESHWEATLFRWKHPRAFKTQVNPEDQNSTYTPGLLHETFTLNLGWGTSYLWMEKGINHGIELRGTWSGGLAMGMLKPVYLQIIYPNEDPNTSKDQPFIEKAEAYDPEKHNTSNIAKASPWFKGVDDLRIIPGIYVKGGLSAEWGKQSRSPQWVELGVMAGLFPKPLPTMAWVENKPYLLSLYLAYQMGRRK
ncbi:MAG: hypothetical protein ACKOAV_00730 [Bacteroidota bacterium]